MLEHAVTCRRKGPNKVVQTTRDKATGQQHFRWHVENFAQCCFSNILYSWWPAGYRGTPKIFRYTGKILPVASLLQSAFLVSIRVSIYYVIKQTSRIIQQQDQSVCLSALVLEHLVKGTW